MIYLIYHNGGGLKIDEFKTYADLAMYIKAYPPLQYIVMNGEYIESNL